MKRTPTLLAALAIVMLSATFFAFRSPSAPPAPEGKLKWRMVNVIESVVGGGMGRSKMVIVDDNGTTSEEKVENLFSIGGINFKNVTSNDISIVQIIKKQTDDGWELASFSPGVYSSEGGGIFMTRILFSKH